MTSADAPPPPPPYRAVVEAGDWVAVSGQIGQRDGALVHGGFEVEARQALANLTDRLGEVGLGLGHVVRATAYIRHMNDYTILNAVWAETFAEPRPARSAVAVAELPKGALVEVDAWAHRQL